MSEKDLRIVAGLTKKTSSKFQSREGGPDVMASDSSVVEVPKEADDVVTDITDAPNNMEQAVFLF